MSDQICVLKFSIKSVGVIAHKFISIIIVISTENVAKRKIQTKKTKSVRHKKIRRL